MRDRSPPQRLGRIVASCVGDVGDSALVEPDGDELVSQLGKRRWRVMGDPEDGWWVEVDSDGNELPGDWEYDRKGGYVYCAFA